MPSSRQNMNSNAYRTIKRIPKSRPAEHATPDFVQADFQLAYDASGYALPHDMHLVHNCSTGRTARSRFANRRNSLTFSAAFELSIYFTGLAAIRGTRGVLISGSFGGANDCAGIDRRASAIRVLTTDTKARNPEPHIAGKS